MHLRLEAANLDACGLYMWLWMVLGSLLATHSTAWALFGSVWVPDRVHGHVGQTLQERMLQVGHRLGAASPLQGHLHLLPPLRSQLRREAHLHGLRKPRPPGPTPRGLRHLREGLQEALAAGSKKTYSTLIKAIGYNNYI